MFIQTNKESNDAQTLSTYRARKLVHGKTVLQTLYVALVDLRADCVVRAQSDVGRGRFGGQFV